MNNDFIAGMLIKKNIVNLSVTANIFIFVRCNKSTGYLSVA
jgi:hypothetical protein